MKSAGLYILVFTCSTGIALFFLQPDRPDVNGTLVLADYSTSDIAESREIERTTNVSMYKHKVVLIEGYPGGLDFGDPNQETWFRYGYNTGEGTVITLSFHEHLIGSFDGDSSTTFHFQLPDKIDEGKIYETSPIKMPDAESRLPIGKMNVCEWGNPYYARSLAPNELAEPASVEILQLTPVTVRFKLSVGAVDWLEELPIDDVFEGAIAR